VVQKAAIQQSRGDVRPKRGIRELAQGEVSGELACQLREQLRRSRLSRVQHTWRTRRLKTWGLRGYTAELYRCAHLFGQPRFAQAIEEVVLVSRALEPEKRAKPGDAKVGSETQCLDTLCLGLAQMTRLR
jgi:hypothetical protein